METWGNKVKVALSRLGKTDNYLYTKPEQDWTQEDKQLVISLLRKSKVAENTQMKDLDKIKEFFSQPIPGEDAIDTISMDIPLFLRMLEYAKEDAQEDVDLHDVTQRATELSKMKPFLSMEDYNEIVAAPQEIDEEVGYLSLKDNNPFDDVPSIDIQIIDDKEGVSSPKAFVNFSSMYHSGDNGKMEILKNNPALQDKVMMALQSEFQKTFRRVIHGILGEPFGLREDAFEDTWALNRKKAQSFIEKYPNDTGVGYAKAYLAIDDIVKANKYWNDFVKNIISNIDEATRTEKGKKVPTKYLKGLKATGAKGSKEAMKKEIDRFAGKDEYKKDWDADYTDKGERVKTKPSAATKAFKARFGESISGLIRQALEEGGDPSDKALANKAKKSGIPKGILRQVFNRGKAAWNTGHRPGSTQDQWAMGRVNSFITGSGGARKADADLWKKARKARGKKD